MIRNSRHLITFSAHESLSPQLALMSIRIITHGKRNVTRLMNSDLKWKNINRKGRGITVIL